MFTILVCLLIASILTKPAAAYCCGSYGYGYPYFYMPYYPYNYGYNPYNPFGGGFNNFGGTGFPNVVNPFGINGLGGATGLGTGGLPGFPNVVPDVPVSRTSGTGSQNDQRSENFKLKVQAGQATNNSSNNVKSEPKPGVKPEGQLALEPTNVQTPNKPAGESANDPEIEPTVLYIG